MVPLSEAIRRWRERRGLSDEPEPVDTSQTPDDGPPCDHCRSLRWVGRHDLIPGEPGFGLAIPCPVCSAGMLAQRRLNRLFGELGERLHGHTLDNFQTPQKVYAEYVESVREWVADSGKPWLYLYGKVGRGKTHLAVGAMRAWIESGHSVLFSKVDGLLDHIHRGYKDGSYDDLMQSLLEAELVVLDDLGAEHKHSPEGDWASEKLFALIGGRYDANARMIITSNLSIQGITNHLGHERIARRIHQMSYPKYALNFDKLPYRAEWVAA
jgi:DNA replication protein DnaC